MEKKKIVFGTDGWRGLLGEELNVENIQLVAQAFADYMRLKARNNRVVIGYDGRSQSAVFARLFAEVLRGNRIEVLLSDRVVPTPVVSFIALTRHCDAGVMITASHNPASYNGIKFKASNGSPFSTEETALVESLIGHSLPNFDEKGILEENFLMAYLNHLETLIDFDLLSRSGLKVVVDSMAGAGARILEQLLRPYGLVVDTIYGDPLEDFAGRMAEPVEKNLQPLAEVLRSGNYSLGLATDGDADRLGVMTDSGLWMNVQETILYLAQYIVHQKGLKGPLVKTASVTDKICELLAGSDYSVIDAQVGFKYVAEAMMAHDACFGAEESGGFGFKGHLPERDGIFSALVFLEMMARSGFTSLDTFIKTKRQELGEIFYERVDVENHQASRHQVLPALASHLPETLAGYAVTGMQTYCSSRGLINGLKLRLQGNPRWILLRVSETEPIVRIYAEGENTEEVRQLLKAGMLLF